MQKRREVNATRLARGWPPFKVPTPNLAELSKRVLCWKCGLKGHFKKNCTSTSPKGKKGGKKGGGKMGKGFMINLFMMIFCTVMNLSMEKAHPYRGPDWKQ